MAKMRMVVGILPSREVDMLHVTNIGDRDHAEGTLGADTVVRKFRRLKRSELSPSDLKWAGETVAFHAGGGPWCIVRQD